MSCRHARDDAAYVLGALPPGERLEFERHLAGCDDCTRAVRELAGLPGLLGRVDGTLLEQSPGDQRVSDSLLPSLAREVRRGRRRRATAGVGVAAAAVAAVALGVPVVVDQLDRDEGTTSAVPQGPGREVVTRPMAPVGDVPVEAVIGLEQVTWGTRILLTCTYEPQSVELDLPSTIDYTIVVRTRGGRTEPVGSWRSVGGATMHLTAATSANRTDIASVEVRAPGGRVVLRLDA
jgi:hypothetical protein